MNSCIDSLPSERIRVFISSAQNNENGFAWSEVRRRIKDALNICPYFNPFIIEDEASATPSNQFFLRQVERTDVIVLLVKGEVRTGTAMEYALATRLQKPLFVYFIDDDDPDLDVLKLKKDIQKVDRCTYRRVSTFDNIEGIVRNDLMNDIVRAYQDKFFVSSLDNDSSVRSLFQRETVLVSPGIPTKTEIDKFGSCYSFFFDLMKLPFNKKDMGQTEFHELGCSLLFWLVEGEWKVDDEIILDFTSNCLGDFKNKSWLQKRWDAIRCYFQNDLKKALVFEENALEIAREAKESDWVVNNILIDCRNIEIAINNLEHRLTIDSKYQNELSAQKSTVFLPVLDRYLNNIYETINNDEFREETATPYTQLLGSGMKNAIIDLANYLFTAAIYGSITHLLITRQVFANILSRYSKIHNESSFLFSSLKQYILDGKTNSFNLFFESTRDKQYSYITSQADEIWKLTERVPVANKETMKLSIFAALGPYLSEDVFINASDYILGYSDSVFWGDCELYFDALLSNLQRMNPDQILRAMIPIIAEKRFILGNKLSQIIIDIDLNRVNDQILQNLSEALTAQLPFIICHNGNPQMIAPLVGRDKALFGHLETLEGNGLSGLQKSIYKINRGSEDWCSVIKKEIDCARLQFEQNNEKGIFHGFVYEPYSMISAIIRRKTVNKKIENLLLNDFIPLSIDVLNSEASIQTKEPCVACLCEILSYLSKRNIELPLPVKRALQTVNVDSDTEDFFMPISRKALEIRVLMAQIIVGILDENALLRWCIEYEKLEIKEKIVVIDCLEKYLYYKKNNLDTIDSLLVSIVLQCHSATHRDIRKVAVRCLAYLVSSKYRDIATIELNKAVYDSSFSVRSALLGVCANGCLPTEFSNSLITVLCNDAHYNIRFAANELKKRHA